MSKIAAAILIFAFVATAGLAAQAQDTGQDCGNIDSDAPRLRCYDALFRPTTSVALPSQSIGKWRVSTEISPIDDSTKVFLTLTSDNGITNRFGQKSQMQFTIACRENTTSMWFYFGGNFMSDTAGSGRVTYRIDSAAARTKSFVESSNNEALGLWNGGSSIPFVKSLFGRSRLYVQAQPYNESTVSDFFSVAGLEEAIKPLREACHW